MQDGYEAVMVRWRQQQSLQAGSFRTEHGDETLDDALAESGPAAA